MYAELLESGAFLPGPGTRDCAYWTRSKNERCKKFTRTFIYIRIGAQDHLGKKHQQEREQSGKQGEENIQEGLPPHQDAPHRHHLQ